jgi:hypothetical protein
MGLIFWYFVGELGFGPAAMEERVSERGVSQLNMVRLGNQPARMEKWINSLWLHLAFKHLEVHQDTLPQGGCL